MTPQPNRGEIVIYRTADNQVQLDVRMEKDTVWLTQQQIADLFGVKQPAISKHIANIYKSGELEENSTYSILEYMGNDGKQLYSVRAYSLEKEKMMTMDGNQAASHIAYMFTRM